MAERPRRVITLLLAVIVALGLGAGLIFVIAPGAPRAGPVPITWDKELCARCRMHIGEPAFAAQLQTQDGAVHNFDDPGCLFEYVDLEHPVERATYFHHVSTERWLTWAETAFVRKNPTPMGFGFGAVERGTPGAITLEQVRTEVLERLAQKEKQR